MSAQSDARAQAKSDAHESDDFDRKWKSDFDMRLHELKDTVETLTVAVDSLKGERERQRVAMETLTHSVDQLNGVLASGNGALAFLFLMSKVFGAFMVIVGGIGSMVYVAKTWPK